MTNMSCLVSVSLSKQLVKRLQADLAGSHPDAMQEGWTDDRRAAATAGSIIFCKAETNQVIK